MKISITVHARRLDEQYLIITESDLQSLITVAGQVASVQFEESKDNLPIEGLMELAETGGAFDFLLDEREDIYIIDDLLEKNNLQSKIENLKSCT